MTNVHGSINVTRYNNYLMNLKNWLLLIYVTGGSKPYHYNQCH